jgi:hypothetical protein
MVRRRVDDRSRVSPIDTNQATLSLNVLAHSQLNLGRCVADRASRRATKSMVVSRRRCR